MCQGRWGSAGCESGCESGSAEASGAVRVLASAAECCTRDSEMASARVPNSGLPTNARARVRLDSDLAFHGLIPRASEVCDRCDALWQALAAYPRSPSPGSTARTLGFRNRSQFGRWLYRHGHPQLQELRDWFRVARWLNHNAFEHRGLVHEACEVGLEPSVCYRTVHRLTGQGWSLVSGVQRPAWLDRFKSVLRNGTCRVSRERDA